MSLLLDALRRAGTARGGGIAEPVNQRPGADDTASARSEADEFDLDIDAVTAAGADSKSGGGPGTMSLNGPARAEAVFRGGASGGAALRTAAVFTVGTVAVLGGLVFAGWYYYESTRSAVDQELVRFNPDTAADRPTEAGTTAGGVDASAAEALDPDAEDSTTAGADGGESADSGSSDTGTDDPTVDAAAALATLTQSGSADGGATDARASEPDVEASGSDASAGDAGTAAPTASASAEAESGSASAEADAGANEPDSDAPRERGATSASAAAPENGTSSADVRASAETSGRPIVRSTGRADGRSPLAEALQEGYRALRSGDLMTAREHYREAVELDPSNRDARLGAAAVAQRQGNTAAAIEHYRKVLADHPRDPYARSGLASLESTADPRQIESELKTLLKQNPNAHALRYALGNLYARENRWSQAQAAYFEAFRAAPNEADYAFNLAVALDQLGQRESAVEYYGQALELAGDGSASFALESARRRLESLRQ